jgi:L-ascorbate metabolism protein UlaG (beta-lactamase superfamily)
MRNRGLHQENGLKIWHAGDTGLFGEMKFIYCRYKADLVLVPIGGNFTMDSEDAAFGMKTLIPAKTVIPIYNGSNTLTKGTAAGVYKGADSSVKCNTLGFNERGLNVASC